MDSMSNKSACWWKGLTSRKPSGFDFRILFRVQGSGFRVQGSVNIIILHQIWMGF